ncbi:gene transfer agent family protein [Emcibacter sp.]|uniref:gene transfer agent family protein n=1 Tax=Emcibacter sp. TaxID=1979954 RepID=UPI002AA8FF0D|nr:gene transfer agent family protein [Emcibacter sp.]
MAGRDVRLTLAGQEYVLRPTFQAIMEVEERLGGLLALTTKAADGEIGLREVAVILWATMQDRPDFEQVGKMIMEEGLVKSISAVRDILAICLTGGGEPVLPGKS